MIVDVSYFSKKMSFLRGFLDLAIFLGAFTLPMDEGIKSWSMIFMREKMHTSWFLKNYNFINIG